MWKKLNPAIPKRFLFLLAGSLWICIGILLCTRAILWLSDFSLLIKSGMIFSGFLLAMAGYKFGMSKIVRKNIHRIHGLPESVCCFAFTPLRGYTMILVMIALGITLRNSSLPRVYLAIPYCTMGGALLLGSRKFIREFLKNKN